MPFDALVRHYTVTYDDQDIGRAEIDAMHRARGWSGIGDLNVIRLDGRRKGRAPPSKVGAHVAGQNTGKYGLVTVGACGAP